MKTLLASTALAMGLFGVASAQGVSTPGFVAAARALDIHASDLIGASLHAADYEGDAQTRAAGADADLEDIGSIDDILLTRNGDVRAVLVDVGGFLGIGSKTVAVEMGSLNFVDDGDGDWRVVIDGSRGMLEAAPEFERVAVAGAITGSASARSLTSSGADSAPAMTIEGWTEAEPDALTAEAMEGVPVHDARDESVGSIADLVLTGGGEIEAAVIDVGGFLGMGAHRVSVPFEQVSILRETEGDGFRAHVDLDERTLRDMPAFDG